MVDCVVVLRHQVLNGSAFRNLRVVKYRLSGFTGDEFPISLTSEGMQLTNRGPKELKYAVANERISSGLPRLDHMLNGGYYRGSNVLISGAPGTAKSTLSGLFAAAACRRGERTPYVSFDEGAAQVVRNLRSVDSARPAFEVGPARDVFDLTRGRRPIRGSLGIPTSPRHRSHHRRRLGRAVSPTAAAPPATRSAISVRLPCRPAPAACGRNRRRASHAGGRCYVVV
jgi:hypothetical protein